MSCLIAVQTVGLLLLCSSDEINGRKHLCSKVPCLPRPLQVHNRDHNTLDLTIVFVSLVCLFDVLTFATATSFLLSY